MHRILIVMAGCAVIGACTSFPQPSPPTDKAIATLEVSRVMTPLASPTRTEGAYIVESPPSVETRIIACVPDGGAFTCSFESRTRAFLETMWAPWEARTMRVTWNARIGGWFEA